MRGVRRLTRSDWRRRYRTRHGRAVTTATTLQFPVTLRDDTTAAKITRYEVVSRPASGDTYGVGETISVEAVFDKKVDVNAGRLSSPGRPYVNLHIGSTNKRANYVSGSGTTRLRFSYIVVSGDEDTNGIHIQEDQFYDNPTSRTPSESVLS